MNRAEISRRKERGMTLNKIMLGLLDKTANAP
jgi:hypothetical protein